MDRHHWIGEKPRAMTDYFDEFRQARARQEKTLWAQADAALALRADRGRSTASELAEANNLSAAYVRQLIHTAEAFPPTLRNPELSFTHHRFAAMSDKPAYWLQQAVQGEWPRRALVQAIRLDPNETRKRKKHGKRPTSGQPAQRPSTSDGG